MKLPVIAPGVRNATICITHGPDGLTGAEALLLPVAVTILSSAILPSGDVRILWVKPLPGPVVNVSTVLAAKMRSVALAVVAAEVLLVVLLPLPAAVTSTGLLRFPPLYSRIRMSG